MWTASSPTCKPAFAGTVSVAAEDLSCKSNKKIATFPEGHIAWNLLWSQVRIGEDLESSHDVSGEPVGRPHIQEPIFTDISDLRQLFQIAITLDSWGYVTESMGKYVKGYGYFGPSQERSDRSHFLQSFCDAMSFSPMGRYFFPSNRNHA